MDTYSVSQDDGETSSPAREKRPRAKQACEPCRLRKRRCDGAMPCNMCRQFEYKCYFEKHPRKRSKLVEQNAHHEQSPDYVRPEPPAQDRFTAEDTLKTRSMEANSGIAFTRLLGQRLDPSFGPKLFTFAWNLGMVSYVPPPVTPITEFLDQNQMYALAKAHFNHIHLLYGFLDKEWVLQQISMRWAQPEHCTIPDHLLANLAAVGSLYGDASLHSRIPMLLESAKKALEATSLMQPPNVIDVQSWLLRCMYLRSTGHPHACHTATCIVMHLVEAIGLHEETSNTTLHPPTITVQGHQTAEIRRRTFWSARMINTWVSFEYGRSRVTLRGITTQLPTPRDGDYTLDYLNLYSLSCFLDPERSESQWEDFLRQLDEYESKHDAIEMSKGNLALCGYRRIRLVNPNPSSEITNSIIRIGLSAVEAAQRLCRTGVPWWHMANVPFQAICVFLAMDLRESLSHISAALEVLEEVVERFPTASSKEALKMARSLVRLSKRRKDEDSDILGQTLKRSASKGHGAADLSMVTTPQPPVDGEVVSGAVETSPTTLSNGEDWAFDVINNSDFDWNVFLTAEMPAFNSFAPDGTM